MFICAWAAPNACHQINELPHTFFLFNRSIEAEGQLRLNTMNPKLRELLNVEEDHRIKVLEYFGLFTFVPIDDDYTGEVYEYNDEGVYGPWGKAYNFVSEEEFQRLLSLYNLQVYNMKVQSQKEEAKPLVESNPYNHNAERKLNSMAFGLLAYTIVLAVVLVFVCISFIDHLGGGEMLIVVFSSIVSAIAIVASVYMWYLTIKVFTNISCRATEIHKLLKDKK